MGCNVAVRERGNEKSSEARQSTTKPRGKGSRGMYLPESDKYEIICKRMEGKSLRQIARETERDFRTVAKVLDSDEMKSIVSGMRSQLLTFSDEWIAGMRRCWTTEMDGRLSYQLAKDFGVIPNQAKQIDVNQQLDSGQQKSLEELTEEEKVDFYTRLSMWQLAYSAFERNRVYGTELPVPQEELNARVQRSIESGTIRDVPAFVRGGVSFETSTQSKLEAVKSTDDKP